MEYLAGGIAFIIFVIVYSRWEQRKKRKRIEEVFADRTSRSPAQFYEQYFREQGIPEHVVLGVRKILEDCLNADLSKMQDSDDFSRNLSFFWDYDSMADVEIVLALEKMFRINITDQEFQDARTVRDVIELVVRKVQ